MINIYSHLQASQVRMAQSARMHSSFSLTGALHWHHICSHLSAVQFLRDGAATQPSSCPLHVVHIYTQIASLCKPRLFPM